jgi:hypothetical protein
VNTIKKTIEIEESVQTTVNFKRNVLTDLNRVAEAANVTRAKLVNALVENYLYSDNIIIRVGTKEVDVQKILKG